MSASVFFFGAAAGFPLFATASVAAAAVVGRASSAHGADWKTMRPPTLHLLTACASAPCAQHSITIDESSGASCRRCDVRIAKILETAPRSGGALPAQEVTRRCSPMRFDEARSGPPDP